MDEVRLHHRQGTFSLDVSFTVSSRWTVLFGPSGAGKSTILRGIAGLLHPQDGRVCLNHRVLLDTRTGTALPPGRRSVGFVTQQPSLFPHLRVRDNVAFGIRQWPQQERRARVAEMLAFFGAADLADRRAPELSGGERQRVALARALAPRPQFLLLDEPLAALDAASGQDILARLLRLDIHVLYVSHDLAEIWRMPAEVVVIDAGRVIQAGPLQQTLAAYRDELLQRLQ